MQSSGGASECRRQARGAQTCCNVSRFWAASCSLCCASSSCCRHCSAWPWPADATASSARTAAAPSSVASRSRSALSCSAVACEAGENTSVWVAARAWPLAAADPT